MTHKSLILRNAENKHFTLKFLPVLICLMLIAASAVAEEIDGDGRYVLGGYSFIGNETTDRPNVFVSLNPSEDGVFFDENAVLDANIPFVFADFNVWEQWYRETGADPNRVGEYNLRPLSVFTIGNAYSSIILDEGARVINRAVESDGMMVLGPVSFNIGENAIVHGAWAGITLGNFSDPEDAEFYEINLVNLGRIGSFMEDPEATDEDTPPIARNSRTGLLIYEGVGGNILNESGGVIAGQSFGIRSNYSEGKGDFIPMPGDPENIEYFEGRLFNLENHGEIRGVLSDAIFEGGGVEFVNIVNHESGVIDGGRAGIILLRGGVIENRGTIRGGETGIYVANGTPTITHSGVLEITGEKGGDAIRFAGNVKGGTITLYSTVAGDILHVGDSSEAILSIGSTEDAAAAPGASVGNIGFGEGSITQYGGRWTYKDITADNLRLEGGDMRLSKKITVAQDVTIAQNAAMTVTGGSIAVENFINQGTRNLHDGEITVNSGLFDYSDLGNARDFNLVGNAKDQNPRLRLVDGAAVAGIDALSIGGKQAGTLTLVDSSVSFQDRLTVQNKGRLAGVGSVGGNVSVGAGGALAPGYMAYEDHDGDPTGTLAIDGNLVIENGAAVEIGIMRGNDNNSRIDASGDVTIAGGTVNVIDLSGRAIQDGAVYTFLNSPYSVAGRFDAITGSSIFGFELDYWLNSVSFKVTRLTDYDDFAATPNQAVMANAYQTARSGGYLPKLVPAMEGLLEDALAEREPTTMLEGALDQLSPEPFQAGSRMVVDTAGQMSRHLMNGARRTRLKMALAEPDATDDRARIVPGETGTSTWAKPIRLFYGTFYQYTDVDADEFRTGYYHRGRGFYLGYERSVSDRLNAGASISYANNYAGFDDKRGILEIDTFRFGPHATITRGGLEINIALNGGLHLNRQERSMIYPLPATAVSHYDIYDGSAFTDVRYNLDMGNIFRLTPTASLQYTYQYRKDVTEQRGGDINLNVDSGSHTTLLSILGMSISREFRRNTAVIVPELFGSWRNEMGDRDMDISAAFINAPGSPEGGFTVTGQGSERDFYVAGACITFLFGEFNVAYLGYEREFRDAEDVEIFSGGVKWNF